MFIVDDDPNLRRFTRVLMKHAAKEAI